MVRRTTRPCNGLIQVYKSFPSFLIPADILASIKETGQDKNKENTPKKQKVLKVAETISEVMAGTKDPEVLLEALGTPQTNPSDMGVELAVTLGLKYLERIWGFRANALQLAMDPTPVLLLFEALSSVQSPALLRHFIRCTFTAILACPHMILIGRGLVADEFKTVADSLKTIGVDMPPEDPKFLQRLTFGISNLLARLTSDENAAEQELLLTEESLNLLACVVTFNLDGFEHGDSESGQHWLKRTKKRLSPETLTVVGSLVGGLWRAAVVDAFAIRDLGPAKLLQTVTPASSTAMFESPRQVHITPASRCESAAELTLTIEPVGSSYTAQDHTMTDAQSVKDTLRYSSPRARVGLAALGLVASLYPEETPIPLDTDLAFPDSLLALCKFLQDDCMKVEADWYAALERTRNDGTLIVVPPITATVEYIAAILTLRLATARADSNHAILSVLMGMTMNGRNLNFAYSDAFAAACCISSIIAMLLNGRHVDDLLQALQALSHDPDAVESIIIAIISHADPADLDTFVGLLIRLIRAPRDHTRQSPALSFLAVAVLSRILNRNHVPPPLVLAPDAVSMDADAIGGVVRCMCRSGLPEACMSVVTSVIDDTDKGGLMLSDAELSRTHLGDLTRLLIDLDPDVAAVFSDSQLSVMFDRMTTPRSVVPLLQICLVLDSEDTVHTLVGKVPIATPFSDPPIGHALLYTSTRMMLGRLGDDADVLETVTAFFTARIAPLLANHTARELRMTALSHWDTIVQTLAAKMPDLCRQFLLAIHGQGHVATLCDIVASSPASDVGEDALDLLVLCLTELRTPDLLETVSGLLTRPDTVYTAGFLDRLVDLGFSQPIHALDAAFSNIRVALERIAIPEMRKKAYIAGQEGSVYERQSYYSRHTIGTSAASFTADSDSPATVSGADPVVSIRESGALDRARFETLTQPYPYGQNTLQDAVPVILLLRILPHVSEGDEVTLSPLIALHMHVSVCPATARALANASFADEASNAGVMSLVARNFVETESRALKDIYAALLATLVLAVDSDAAVAPLVKMLEAHDSEDAQELMRIVGPCIISRGPARFWRCLSPSDGLTVPNATGLDIDAFKSGISYSCWVNLWSLGVGPVPTASPDDPPMTGVPLVSISATNGTKVALYLTPAAIPGTDDRNVTMPADPSEIYSPTCGQWRVVYRLTCPRGTVSQVSFDRSEVTVAAISRVLGVQRDEPDPDALVGWMHICLVHAVSGSASLYINGIDVPTERPRVVRNGASFAGAIPIPELGGHRVEGRRDKHKAVAFNVHCGMTREKNRIGLAQEIPATFGLGPMCVFNKALNAREVESLFTSPHHVPDPCKGTIVVLIDPTFSSERPAASPASYVAVYSSVLSQPPAGRVNFPAVRKVRSGDMGPQFMEACSRHDPNSDISHAMIANILAKGLKVYAPVFAGYLNDETPSLRALAINTIGALWLGDETSGIVAPTMWRDVAAALGKHEEVGIEVLEALADLALGNGTGIRSAMVWSAFASLFVCPQTTLEEQVEILDLLHDMVGQSTAIVAQLVAEGPSESRLADIVRMCRATIERRILQVGDSHWSMALWVDAVSLPNLCDLLNRCARKVGSRDALLPLIDEIRSPKPLKRIVHATLADDSVPVHGKPDKSAPSRLRESIDRHMPRSRRDSDFTAQEALGSDTEPGTPAPMGAEVELDLTAVYRCFLLRSLIVASIKSNVVTQHIVSARGVETVLKVLSDVPDTLLARPGQEVSLATPGRLPDLDVGTVGSATIAESLRLIAAMYSSASSSTAAALNATIPATTLFHRVLKAATFPLKSDPNRKVVVVAREVLTALLMSAFGEPVVGDHRDPSSYRIVRTDFLHVLVRLAPYVSGPGTLREPCSILEGCLTIPQNAATISDDTRLNEFLAQLGNYQSGPARPMVRDAPWDPMTFMFLASWASRISAKLVVYRMGTTPLSKRDRDWLPWRSARTPGWLVRLRNEATHPVFQYRVFSSVLQWYDSWDLTRSSSAFLPLVDSLSLLLDTTVPLIGTTSGMQGLTGGESKVYDGVWALLFRIQMKLQQRDDVGTEVQIPDFARLATFYLGRLLLSSDNPDIQRELLDRKAADVLTTRAEQEAFRDLGGVPLLTRVLLSYETIFASVVDSKEYRALLYKASHVEQDEFPDPPEAGLFEFTRAVHGARRIMDIVRHRMCLDPQCADELKALFNNAPEVVARLQPNQRSLVDGTVCIVMPRADEDAEHVPPGVVPLGQLVEYSKEAHSTLPDDYLSRFVMWLFAPEQADIRANAANAVERQLRRYSSGKQSKKSTKTVIKALAETERVGKAVAELVGKPDSQLTAIETVYGTAWSN
ncbi:hypothetical protein J8273_4103 [Carpediemonas membranifera]|uniref:Uncharacterized protein n=1 Tax=Carpediemonas membranifera TaxID=201153 RepID=A0A8J6AUE9_9EUKA|nr:hypothetical protein J8273_4103 [Carpediemonas membranifera]|eukprot:KAG9394438.1 hypothetical protein J8273_4103 [Carpediemonas membranifera]